MLRAPKFWQDRNLLSYTLAPLGFAYGLATTLRRKSAPSYRAKIPVFCIGNLTLGGSGKTPTAQKLARLLLARNHRPAFLTRGYGGKAKGPLLVDLQRHHFPDIGEEAMLLAEIAPTIISHDRAAGAQLIESLMSDYHFDCLIMDDGLQNPSLDKDINLVVIDGAQKFGNGLCFPAGPLRESPRRLAEIADQILVVNPKDGFSLDQNLSFTTAQTDWPASFTPNPDDRYIAFCGIGYPPKFFNMLEAHHLHLASKIVFADHHAYDARDEEKLLTLADHHNAKLITTEKDFLKLSAAMRSQVIKLPLTLTIPDEKAFLLPFLKVLGDES